MFARGPPRPRRRARQQRLRRLIDLFFNQQPAADLGKQGGILGSDGLFDNNDFVVFIDQFFTGC